MRNPRYNVRVRLDFEYEIGAEDEEDALTKAVNKACAEMFETHPMDMVDTLSWSVNGGPWQSKGINDHVDAEDSETQ